MSSRGDKPSILLAATCPKERLPRSGKELPHVLSAAPMSFHGVHRVS